jgi:uncharacterized protein involved in exopolysaccharide biosynthesis
LKELLPYVGLLALLLSVVNTAYQYRKDKRGDSGKAISDAIAPFKTLPDAVSEIKAELQVLKKQVEVFWKGVSFSSAQALHSPHTKELDTLLEKFQRDEIQNEKDLQRLKELLKGISKEDPDPVRQKFALDILTLIHVRFEIGGDLIDALRKQNQSVDHSIHSFSARLK